MTITLRKHAAGVLLAIVGLAACGSATGASTSVVTTPIVTTGGAAAVTTTVTSAPITAPPTTTPPVAHVGTTLSLQNGAEHVTLVKLLDPAQGSDPYMPPDAGKRFVGLEFQVAIVSSAGTGNANNDATLIGSDNQTYTADFGDIAGCTNFNHGIFTLSVGQTATGCVVFQVPTTVQVSKVEWQPAGGFSGVAIGEWVVP